MYINTSTFNKTFDSKGLVYFVANSLEEKIKIGQIVEVPIGNNIEIALVLKKGSLEQLGIKTELEEKIKSIISIKNENIFLSKGQIKLVNFISSFYFSLIHNSLCLFFPRNLRDKINKNKLPSLENKKASKNVINYSFLFNKTLSYSQKKIYEKINKSEKKKFLLYGVTGSGKTEIYIKLIKTQLDLGKQSLLLIPEIILTNQLEIRLKEVFGENILIINSSINEAKKTKAWISIHSKVSKIIIGTRSALFYPYNNLGLIIIDEEHDNSYVSENTPRYNSLEVAEEITKINKNKLLLASGTPSIKSMYKATKGDYELLSLLEKFE